MYHHGIKGQRWGVRRFQKKDGSRTSAGKVRQRENSQKKGLTDKQKRAIKIGAAVVGASLVAAGGVYLYKTGKLQTVGNNFITKELHSANNGIGKSINDISKTMVANVNSDGRSGSGLSADYQRNCAHTSIAYIMNSVLGYNVKAKGYGGVDELSGLVTGNFGRSKAIFSSVFDGIKTTEVPFDEQRLDLAIKHISSGTTGIVRLKDGDYGHFLNYEKDKLGNLTFVDCQSSLIVPVEKVLASGARASITDIFDCSNATLKDGATETLKFLVKGE